LNKIDRLEDGSEAKKSLSGFSDVVAVSALTGEGIEELLPAIHRKLFESYESIKVMLPYQQGALLAMFHEQGQVEQVEHTRKGVILSGRIPGRLLARYKAFEFDGRVEEDEE
jgi:GTP-binding protein HflX